MISLLDLGVEKPREAMTFGAPETEALYEGSAQKGFGVPSIDGSPMPLGSIATNEITVIVKNPVDQEAQQPKTKECKRYLITIRGRAGDKLPKGGSRSRIGGDGASRKTKQL